MAEITIKNLANGSVGKEVIDDSIVKATFNPTLLNDYVVMQRRALRQGTHSTKTRAEVSGTGKKPFRQKGTGNARQGTLIGPHQPGGGIAFGPKPRNYESSMNAKAKREALRGALSQKNYEGKLFAVEDFVVASGKTKDAWKTVASLGGRSYLVIGEFDAMTLRSAKNIQSLKLLSVKGLNVFDILKHDQVLLTKAAIKAVTERLAA